MRRPATGTFALLIAVVLTAGCGPAATVEPSSTARTSASTWPEATPPGGSRSSEPSLPGIPAGLPVMPGAEAADPQPADPSRIARWLVEAIGPDVYAFYLDALPGAGFVVEERFPGGNVAVIRFSTPEGTTLDLALVGEGGGDQTRIDLRLPEGP